MNNLTIIITMAGLGSRFRKAGYDCPKYQIMAKGKTLFEWSMESLTDYIRHAGKAVFIVRKEDQAADFIREKCRVCGIPNPEVLEIDYLTDGQATTCLLSMPMCPDENPILVYNIDTYVESGAMAYADIRGDGHIPCFNAEGDHWSFVRTDESGKAVEVAEKVRISDNCTLGAYYFSSAKLYKELYAECYENGQQTAKERYIAPMYQKMIDKGLEVSISLVDPARVHVLGTPEELEVFLKS